MKCSDHQLRVLLVADLEDWILGRLARHLSQLLSDRMQITVLVSHSKGFQTSFDELQRQHDVVHFLSPWDFFDMADRTFLPCVVTLWHMVDWSPFEAHADRIDTLCVGSEQWLQRVTNHVPRNLPVRRMRYGLDTDRFQKDPSAKPRFLQGHGLAKQVLTFGFAGSAWSNESNRKGLDRLWKCLIRLKDELDVPFVLRIIGRYWPPEMIPSELKPVTRLEPDIPSARLPEFYSSLDYYVCTSLHEGVPYPVLEAMSCECVVISTPVGVVPEILVHGENGFVLREESLEADFVNIIRQTASDHNLRKACDQRARETVVRSFSWDRVVNPLEYQETYNTAIRFYKSRSISRRVGFALRSKILAHTGRIRLRIRLRSTLRRLIQVVDRLQ